jgi:hypothetical protein
MVMYAATLAVLWTVLLAEQKEPVLEQLDPPRRAAVVMALLALVLTGLLLVTCIMLGAHWVRRLARHKPDTRAINAAEAAAQNRKLRDALQSVLPEAKSDDTIHLGRAPGDTQAD